MKIERRLVIISQVLKEISMSLNVGTQVKKLYGFDSMMVEETFMIEFCELEVYIREV